MKDRKPWSEIKVKFISNNNLSQIEQEVSLICDLVDLNNEQFSIHEASQPSIEISTLEMADVVIIHSLPHENQKVKKNILSAIIKRNIPCWIYGNGFIGFCEFMEARFTNDTVKPSKLDLTGMGRKDPVFSILPDQFPVTMPSFNTFPIEVPKPLKVLARTESKLPAVIKMDQQPAYAIAFHPKNNKELLMQFLREYVGYLEYLA